MTQDPGRDLQHRARLQKGRVSRVDLDGGSPDAGTERLHEAGGDDTAARNGRRARLAGEEALTATTDRGVPVCRVLAQKDVDRSNRVEDRILQGEALPATLDKVLDRAEVDSRDLLHGDPKALADGFRGGWSRGTGSKRIGNHDRVGVRSSTKRELGGREDVLAAVVGPAKKSHIFDCAGRFQRRLTHPCRPAGLGHSAGCRAPSRSRGIVQPA